MRLPLIFGIWLLVGLTSIAIVPASEDPEPRADQIRPEPNRGGAVDMASTDVRIALERLKPAEGYEISLFASEKEFPELAKPLAMTFDTRGRLWVLTSPTYPHVLPGVPPHDRLVVLEDANQDGRAELGAGRGHHR